CYGGDVRSRRRAMLGARHGGSAHVGGVNEKRRSRVYLLVRVLARNVHAVGRRGRWVGDDRPSAACRHVDGVGQALFCDRHDRRRPVLPRQNGAVDAMTGPRSWIRNPRWLLAAGLIAFTSVRARAQDIGLELGTTAPAAKVYTLDGKEADLAQYIGKTPIVMEFWATWCPNCKELEPTMIAAAKKYGDQVKFVGIAVSVNETPERVKAFVEKHGLPGDHYFDAKGNASGAYDAPATSYVVVI